MVAKSYASLNFRNLVAIGAIYQLELEVRVCAECKILIGKALKENGLREKVQISTKFGVQWIDGKPDVCGDPVYVRSCCEGSFK
ncbi:putative 3-isopropylmalate dehydratase [Helianthus anomalus]